ncbi:MAG: hypothetical protein ABIH21_03295 [Patescibacteria group bacterium]
MTISSHPHKNKQKEHEPSVLEEQNPDIAQELKEIYQDTDGQMPDFQNLERAESSNVTKWLVKLILSLLVLSAAAWAGFFVWTHNIFEESKPLEISIEGPEEVNSGQEVTYTIRYANQGKVPIASLETKLSLPLGFNVTNITPEPSDTKDTWILGPVTERSDGAIQITGKFRTETQTSQVIQALFTYKSANYNSEFQELKSIKVNVENSVLVTEISGPQKALAGDDVTYTVNIENTALEVAEQIELFVEFPDVFSVSSTQPEVSVEDSPVWIIESIEPGEKAEITITGTYTSTATGEQIVTSKIFFINTDSVKFLQATAQTITDMLGGNLAFNLIVDGTSENQTADPGETLLTSISYENKSNEIIEGLKFNIEFTDTNGKLPFNEDGLEIDLPEELITLQPGDQAVIDLTIPILSNIDLTKYSDKFTMNLSAEYEKVGSIESERSIAHKPITILINSNLNVDTKAQYYSKDGETVGDGPLPPKAHETTSYEIIWTLKNTMHDIENITMTTKLPQDVAWQDKERADMGILTFDTTTRMVTWHIDRLPTSTPEARAYLHVAITPEIEDVGAFFKLTNTTTVEATDTVTQKAISSSFDTITTELLYDEYAHGKGVVME